MKLAHVENLRLLQADMALKEDQILLVVVEAAYEHAVHSAVLIFELIRVEHYSDHVFLSARCTSFAQTHRKRENTTLGR